MRYDLSNKYSTENYETKLNKQQIFNKRVVKMFSELITKERRKLDND